MVLVTVAAQGLPAGDVICAPDNTWTPVQAAGTVGNPVYTVTTSSGPTALTQESFWSSTNSASSYQFTFETSCSGGSSASAGASAVSVAFSGVNPGSAPVDASAGAAGTVANDPGKTLTAPSVVTTVANDEVVSLFATEAPSLSPTVSTTGAWTNSAASWALQPTKGTSTPGTANSGTASDYWTAETVAFLPPTTSSVTIDRPTPGTGDFLVVTVSAQALGTEASAPRRLADVTWNQIGTQQTTGSNGSELTQATFYSFPQDTSQNDTYTFSFETACGGSPITGIAWQRGRDSLLRCQSASPIDASGTNGRPGDTDGTLGDDERHW